MKPWFKKRIRQQKQESLKVQHFSMGCQTDEPIDVGRPKTTQTELIEKNDIETQVDEDDLKANIEKNGTKLFGLASSSTSMAPSNSLLQIPSFVALRNQFYLPNLISGSLLAFAGNFKISKPQLF